MKKQHSFTIKYLSELLVEIDDAAAKINLEHCSNSASWNYSKGWLDAYRHTRDRILKRIERIELLDEYDLGPDDATD